MKGESIKEIASSFDKFVKTGDELIAIETVLRDFCKNCQEEGHKIWNCPYLRKIKKKVSKTDEIMSLIKCQLCNATSHLTRDCPRNKYEQNKTELDKDYEFFKYMKELEASK